MPAQDSRPPKPRPPERRPPESSRWRRLAPLLDFPPDGASQRRCERALLKTAPTSGLPLGLLPGGHPVRDLAGARAFLVLLDEASGLLEAPLRESRLVRLGASLASVNSNPDSALARSLAASLGPRGFELDWLAAALTARRNESSRATFLTRRELGDHALAISGRLPRALARAGGDDSERAGLQSDALARAAALGRELGRLLAGWNRGCLFLALEDLDRHSVPATALAKSPPPIELKPVVLEHIAWLRGLLVKSRGLGQGLPPASRLLMQGAALSAELVLRRVELLGLRR